MSKKILYQEEIKIVLSEVFRDGDMNDEYWTAHYEGIKKVVDISVYGSFIDSYVRLGYTIEEAVQALKNLLAQKKRENEINNL